MGLEGNSMFQFRDTSTGIDPEKLVIRKGDTVLYENVEYIVKEAGMRWIRVVKKHTPDGEYSMRKTDVAKLYPEVNGPQAGNETSE